MHTLTSDKITHNETQYGDLHSHRVKHTGSSAAARPDIQNDLRFAVNNQQFKLIKKM